MDRRLTAYVLKYLLEHRFESKAEMARQLGMRQRTIEKVFANLDVAKAGTIAFDKAIYYCAENHISLDSILESFIEEMKDGVATNETNQQAFNKLRMTKPLSLTTDGEEVYEEQEEPLACLSYIVLYDDSDRSAFIPYGSEHR